MHVCVCVCVCVCVRAHACVCTHACMCSLYLNSMPTYMSSAPDLNIGLGVYLMHSVARGPARLVVQEVALYKDTVLTHTPYPHLTLILLIQYDPWERDREGGGREGGRKGRGRYGKGREGGRKWKMGGGGRGRKREVRR